MADLDRDLAAGGPAPVYVLTGDPLLVERAVARLRDASVPESLRGFNYDVIDPRGATAARILGAAQTLPMMGQRRLVLVRELAALPAAELTNLVPYFEKPNPSTVLVGLAGKVDRRLKLFATAHKLGLIQELAAPRNLVAFVQEEVRRRAVRMTPAAASRLTEVAGKDLGRLAGAVDQLALYAGDRAIEVDDVDDLIADTRERTVFELTDAIGEGNARRAHVAVAALFDQRESPIGVIVMLARHIRQLTMVQAGFAHELGVPPFIADKLSAQARRFAPAALDRALGRLAETDRALKGMAPMMKTLGKGLADRVVLERLVADLLRLGGSEKRGRAR